MKDMEYFKDDFDFSELDESHELYDCKSKKVIEKMRIETSPMIELTELVALRSKSYRYSYAKPALLYGTKDQHPRDENSFETKGNSKSSHFRRL